MTPESYCISLVLDVSSTPGFADILGSVQKHDELQHHKSRYVPSEGSEPLTKQNMDRAFEFGKKMRAMLMWLKTPLVLLASRGQPHWFPKEVRLHVSSWKHDSTFLLIYSLSEPFPSELFVSILSFKSFSRQCMCSFFYIWVPFMVKCRLTCNFYGTTLSCKTDPVSVFSPAHSRRCANIYKMLNINNDHKNESVSKVLWDIRQSDLFCHTENLDKKQGRLRGRTCLKAGWGHEAVEGKQAL